MSLESVEPGRRLVVRVAAIGVASSIVTIVAFNVVLGSGRLPDQMVRFGLTLVLCFFLIRGHRWARWVSVALFAIAGVGSVVGALALPGKSVGAIALFVMGAAYLYCSGVLLASGSVRAFFSTPQPSEPSVASPDSGT
jgi:hypothetical protein